MRQRILEILKNTDGYISGERISEMLDISRAAVWKHIKKLRLEGYGIESVTNRGYRLILTPDVLMTAEIRAGLKTNKIGKKMFFFDETDSTNNEAKRNSSEGDGSVFIAESQNGGKGRLGRGWEAPKGVGIWMSILLKPELPPSEVSKITLIAGLAVCRGISCGAKIKWPNDVVIGSRKVCGILTEMSAEINRVNYIVCGIGINVNISSFEGELADKATSLLIETGKKHNRAEIVRRVLFEFESLYTEFLKNGLKNILPEYKMKCVTLNREVRIMHNGKAVIVRAVDIDDKGSLVAEKDGEKITVNSGEVSVRGIYGYI